MTVIDVNTGKFTGSGGNLEETVTRNNLESAEEIVRQLRLRDIGGIIVIDFIDMVLESNRDLVLRRLTECLGRDRTRHQVAEVTSLGLVQMTRKRVGTGLLEAFGTTCEHCKGRGVLVSTDPAGKAAGSNGSSGGQQGGGRRSRGRGEDKEAKEAAAKDAAAKEAAKAVRDIAKATSKANGDSHTDSGDTDIAPVTPAVTTVEPEPAPEPVTEPAPAAESDEAEPSTRRGAGRLRRRSRRSAGEPVGVEPPPEVAVETVPAGTDSFTRSGEHNGEVPEQTNGRAHDLEPATDQVEQPAEVDSSAPQESSVAAITTPQRRPVRRGASRPAGPPVSANHDG
jgi:ribonuclease E